MSQRIVGVRPLLKVSMQQDIRNIGPWVVLISALSASSVLGYNWVFPEQAEREELAMTVGANPALSLIFGPARDLMTADGFNAWRAGMLGAFFAGMMAILIITRNTRAQEDSGQAELLASGVMSRPTRLATALAMAVVASLALFVLASILTVIFGGDPVNSMMLAATFAASGLVWAGVAAIAAQLGSDARSASSISIAVIGAFFVARGYIDASQAPDWMVWLTPFGWLEQVQPASGHNVWPLLLALLVAILLAGVAFALQSRRDFGMGLVPPRPGPARGGWVGHPGGLTLRLNLGSVMSWTVAFVVLGVVFGVLATSVGEVLAANPMVGQALAAGAVTPADLAFAFLVTILSLVGIIAAVYGVQIVMRVYAEENADRVDPLLAGSLSRPRFLAVTALIAFLGPAVAVIVGGTVIGFVAAASEPSIVAADVIRQSVATIPAVWTLTALSLAVVGAAPRVRLIGWMGVVAAFALTILGPLFRLWDWILGISPFWHVPNVASADPDWLGLLWISMVTVVFIAIGFVGFRRRDII